MSEASEYLHGFDASEQDRLYRQARFLAPKVFEGLNLEGIQRLLEVGCGVGAQTELLLERHPAMRIAAIDRERAQIERAKAHFGSLPELASRCEFLEMNGRNLGFPEHSFDGAWLIWLLEHVPDPVEILKAARQVMQRGGRLFVTEVLNSNLYMHPRTPALMTYWSAYNRVQERLGGDPCVGAKLGHYLQEAGFHQIEISSHPLHYDRRDPEGRSAIFAYWKELLLSGAERLIASGEVDRGMVEEVEKELAEVSRREDAVFYYAFIRAQAKA